MMREQIDFIDVVVDDFTIENPGQLLQKKVYFFSKIVWIRDLF